MKFDKSNEVLNNWIGWLQARIPEANKGHNEFWIRQAMDGYLDQMKEKENERSNK